MIYISALIKAIMKHFNLLLFTLFVSFIGFNTVNAQGNFRVLSNSILTAKPLECDTIAVDVTTYLGCRNFVNNGYTYSVSGNTITVDVKYTSSPICLGALSQPIFNVKMVGIPAGSYTISSEAYLDNVFVNAVTTPISVAACCPSTSQVKASFFLDDSTFCVGDTFYLNNLSANALNFEWFKNDTSFSTSSSPFLIASTVGINTIRLRADSGFCSDDTTLRYRVNANPSVNLGMDTIICQGASITLRPNLPYSSYIWQDSTTLDSLIVNSAGNYSVIAIDSNGCVGMDTVLIGVSVCTFLEQQSSNENIWTVFPNPVDNKLFINHSSLKSTNFTYKIISLTGQLISEGILTNTHSEISTQHLEPGVYLIQVMHGNTTSTKKITKK